MCDCNRLMNEALEEKNLTLNEALLGPYRGRVLIQTLVIEKRRGFKPAVIFPKYCPFCGEKYPEVS
jgi:hypothetical protein